MKLENNQFLKIKLTTYGDLYFEIYETRKPDRPFRWSLIVGMNRLVNRHSTLSKVKLISESIETVYMSFLNEFDRAKFLREFVK